MWRAASCMGLLLLPYFLSGDQAHLVTFFTTRPSGVAPLQSFSRILPLGGGRLFPIRAIPLPICTNKDGKELLPKIV